MALGILLITGSIALLGPSATNPILWFFCTAIATGIIRSRI